MLSKIRTGLSALVITVGLAIAAPALAAPVVYTLHADQAGGTANGVAFGPNSTYDVVITADTANIAAASVQGGAGTCVLGDTASASIAGGPAQAISTPLYVCIRNDGGGLGVYIDTGLSAAIYSAGTMGGASTLTTIASTPVPTGTLHSHGNSFTVNLTAGGAFRPTAPDPANTTASFFSVAAAAPTVPTLSEWAMILLGTLLAGGAALYLQRRRVFH